MVVRIAYLAPEIPALSATFVYEELHALERRGFSVAPLSVHGVSHKALGEESLAARTITVYDRPKWRIALIGLGRLPFQPGAIKALTWLFRDMNRCGFGSADAWKLGFQCLAAVRVADTLIREECKHLHIHFAHVPTQVGMFAAALAGIPFTVMAHANDIFERGLLLVQKAERAKKFLTISEHNRAYLLSLGLPADKLAVVRCGVSFQPPAAWPTPATKARYRIGTLGRLVEKKGVDVLLQALVGLDNVQLSIAGDGPLREELETLAESLGVIGSVEFVGSLSHREVASWLAGLDGFVLACKQDSNGDMDGIPVVLMEAMSQGIPVISTRLSGIPELVIDGKTGLLATPSDVNDLKSKIAELLASAELRGVLANAAAIHVQQEFGQQANVDRLLSHFSLPKE